MVWVWVLLALMASPGSAVGEAFPRLGPARSPGEIVGGDEDPCSGTLIYHHDGGFESAYTIHYSGTVPPYYGAFGEAYLAPHRIAVNCAAFWFTQVGLYAGQTCDIYVWEGGVTAEPGAVLSLVVGYDPGPPADWPSFSQHNTPVSDGSPHLVVEGAFTIGYWGAWPGEYAGWFVAVDLGPGGLDGSPWVYMHPSQGFGEGWIRPDVVWGETNSFGLGYYYSETSSVGDVPRTERSATWGLIKNLFQ